MLSIFFFFFFFLMIRRPPRSTLFPYRRSSDLEHHSNYMPWRLKAKCVLVDIDDEAVPRYQQLKERLSPRTKLVTLAHVSNVTGVVAPVEEWIATAHAAGVPVMVDASQSVSHLPIDVRKLDCDFLAFSSH